MLNQNWKIFKFGSRAVLHMNIRLKGMCTWSVLGDRRKYYAKLIILGHFDGEHSCLNLLIRKEGHFYVLVIRRTLGETLKCFRLKILLQILRYSPHVIHQTTATNLF